MYIVQLRRVADAETAEVTAKASSLAGALGFIRDYCSIEFGLLEGGWEREGDRFVMYVYDWVDCWFPKPPVVAQIIAPVGFVPQGRATA